MAKTTYTRDCAFCGEPFTLRYPSDRTKTCGQICGGRLAAQSRGDIPWTDKELQFLRERVGEQNVTRIHSNLCRTARRQGWPLRSRGSVSNRLKALCRAEGLGSARATIDGWDLTNLSRLLGIDRRRVKRWTELGLKGTFLQKRWSISRAKLEAWARQNPEYFAGIPADRLIAVMSPEAAQYVFDNSPDVAITTPKPVQCVQTGAIYASRHEAAKAHHVCPSAISQSIRTHYKAAGYDWQHVQSA